MASNEQPKNDREFFEKEVTQQLFYLLDSYAHCVDMTNTLTQEEIKSKITNLMTLCVFGDRQVIFLQQLFDIIGEKDSAFYGRYGQMKYNEK